MGIQEPLGVEKIYHQPIFHKLYLATCAEQFREHGFQMVCTICLNLCCTAEASDCVCDEAGVTLRRWPRLINEVQC